MADANLADGRELWELAVTVPPVTDTVKEALVQCGYTTATVMKNRSGAWAAWQGYEVTEPRLDYEQALEDARRWVEMAERRRLLTNAVDDALRREIESGEDGEPRG